MAESVERPVKELLLNKIFSNPKKFFWLKGAEQLRSALLVHGHAGAENRLPIGQVVTVRGVAQYANGVMASPQFLEKLGNQGYIVRSPITPTLLVRGYAFKGKLGGIGRVFPRRNHWEESVGTIHPRDRCCAYTISDGLA